MRALWHACTKGGGKGALPEEKNKLLPLQQPQLQHQLSQQQLLVAPTSLVKVESAMILLPGASRVLQQILETVRFISILKHILPEKPLEVDFHLTEFDDVRYHIKASAKEPKQVLLSISLPQSPPETVLSAGLPFGAIEAVKGAFGSVSQVVDPPENDYHLTLNVDVGSFPTDEDFKMYVLDHVHEDLYADGLADQLITKLASLRSVVLGAPLREILKHLATKTVAPDADRLVALMHRPRESYFVIPQAEKVTVVFPMRFKDSNDVILGTSFLQEFMEARRSPGLSTAPPCVWSPSPPLELKGAPGQALDANAGFVSFVIFPRHVEGDKLDKSVWILSTFYAYVSYHIKCSKAFMHTRMRRRVETLIQVLNRAKPEVEKEKKSMSGRSFKRAV
ncbi:hypothetical protein AXG93_4794s1100 [Marchantia polymorpha subsp. ruderalis]|uniref:Arp2/3 complex 34 kDa subunit n=1 Tax=Marchantia polymorpha subsp. ruderalis TaxID=1480154 RepID=A0A176VEW7_MARPO|nr:hypothetical protein AXG93_4794s1100 [Marchantia polymorpha subsp. ruderalis]